MYSIPIAYPIKFKIVAPKKLGQYTTHVALVCAPTHDVLCVLIMVFPLLANKNAKFLEEILTYYDGASEKLTIEPENATKLKFLVGQFLRCVILRVRDVVVGEV